MKLFHSYLYLLIFISLTATSPAIAKHSKTGCNARCGTVTIPYPFGIGAKCSINQWYIVDCINSKPYLSALHHLEVLSVDLNNQTVTVSTPTVSHCKNRAVNSSHTVSVDLGSSPFLFSKSHNKFVLEGCGTATMMVNGSVVTGCSTACGNVTDNDRNKCFGNGCCQTAIPHYLKSYSINWERQGGYGGCGSALVVEDETSYEQGRFSDPLILKNTSFIPISLLWTLTESEQVTCCDGRSLLRRVVYMFNGTMVESWKCNYYTQLLLEDNPYLEDGCNSDYAIPKYAKKGCNDTCGNVMIPYPFGIGVDCSLNKWYIVDCNSSKPHLPALNNLELLGVKLEDQIVTVSTRRITNCQNQVLNSSEIMGVDIGSSPFWLSKVHNKFVFEGCGTAALMDNGSVVTRCSTACHNFTHSNINNCFGTGCCQTAIPHYLKSYSIHVTGLEEEDGTCESVFLVEDKTSYDQGRFSGTFIARRNTSFVPVSLLWTLTDSDQVTCCFTDIVGIHMGDMLNGTIVDTWKCYSIYSSYENETGSPYLKDGCNYYSKCRRCEDSGGYCRRDVLYDVDEFVFSRNVTCIRDGERTSLGVILARYEA